jgi:predicted small integral membrane protein
VVTAIVAGELVITAGFAAWLLLSAYNHLSDWRGTVAFVAAFMKMSSLDQEPAIPSPLRSRQVNSTTIHRLAVAVITLVQAGLGVLFAFAAWRFVRGSEESARTLAAYAFAGFAALWFGFLIAGAWFCAWIRQDGLQRTHLLLLGLAILGFVMVSR